MRYVTLKSNAGYRHLKKFLNPLSDDKSQYLKKWPGIEESAMQGAVGIVAPYITHPSSNVVTPNISSSGSGTGS